LQHQIDTRLQGLIILEPEPPISALLAAYRVIGAQTADEHSHVQPVPTHVYSQLEVISN
jgi:hypothetical protein